MSLIKKSPASEEQGLTCRNVTTEHNQQTTSMQVQSTSHNIMVDWIQDRRAIDITSANQKSFDIEPIHEREQKLTPDERCSEDSEYREDEKSQPLEIREPQRPGFETYDSEFILNERLYRSGLYWHGYKNNKPVDIWVASPIHAVASTRDENGANYGLLLSFQNSDGEWREWAAPMRLVSGATEEVKRQLLDLGARVDNGDRNLLGRWMISQNPETKITAATRIGWHGQSFVLPNDTIGDQSIRFQSDYAPIGSYETSGFLEDWRDHVGAMCSGNPMLILAASVAFAGPLLSKIKQLSHGGAGVHLVGDSSKGKSTALQVAASIWSGPEFVGTWRATSNGLEGAAAARNDTLLILDELSECSPHDAGPIVYLLGNGTGKQRASRNGDARQAARWRLMCMSSGERTIASHLAQINANLNAGQQVRMLDIPATDRTHGLFDHLHHHPDGRAFSESLKAATSHHYGWPGRAFISNLIEEQRDLGAIYQEISDDMEFRGSDDLEGRAGAWFALIAFAGQLATEYEITGWHPLEPLRAASEAFEIWRENRGTGSTETRQILDAVSAYLLKYGDSRFTDIVCSHDAPKSGQRAGWWRQVGKNAERIYLMPTEALKEAGGGHDIHRIGKALMEAGWIAAHDPKRRTKKTHVPSLNQSMDLYWIKIPNA